MKANDEIDNLLARTKKLIRAEREQKRQQQTNSMKPAAAQPQPSVAGLKIADDIIRDGRDFRKRMWLISAL